MPAPDKPIGDVHSDMAEQTDRILYDILVNGEEKAVPTNDGGVEKVRVTPSAASSRLLTSKTTWTSRDFRRSFTPRTCSGSTATGKPWIGCSRPTTATEKNPRRKQ